MSTTVWNEEELLSLISNSVKESLHLDYKACNALQKNDDRKKDELSKDVSAFANSDGGTLIYGITEVNNVPINIDDGYDPLVITKEWIEDVITSRISRRIEGIIIHQVILLSHPGKVAYVVVIPQSVNAPHMASDHRFYKRFNFKSCPMEEYEVRDVQNRYISPILSLNVGYSSDNITFKLPHIDDRSINYSNPIVQNISIYNNSSKPAEYTIVMLYYDMRIKVGISSEYEKSDVILGNMPIQRYIHKIAIPGRMPIWKGIVFAFPGSISLEFPQYEDNFYFGWEILSPGMNKKMLKSSFELIDGKLLSVNKEEL